MGRKSETIIGCNICDDSTIAHLFQTIILLLERSTSVDVLQLFNMNDDMTILVSTIATQFQGIIHGLGEKSHNSTTTDPFCL
jgi:hypothetical protein